MNDVPSTEELNGERRSSENLVKKSETGKASVAFEDTLCKTGIEEEGWENAEERRNGENLRGKERKRERPTSAAFFSGKSLLEAKFVRPRSSEPFRGEATPERLSTPPGGRRRRGVGGRRAATGGRGGDVSPGASTGCGCGCGCGFYDEAPGAPWSYLGFPFHPQRKCRSICDFSREKTCHNCEKISDSERDFQKVKRSLRLLGFELSDFGILLCRPETAPKRKPKHRSPTFSTKISRRSISLDSLRVAVKRAWLDDSLDESHRRLLAQAAYEEWYFTKEKELRKKREEDRIKQLKTKLKLREDFERKKEKSEEEFRKWLSRKTTKRKGREGISPQKQEKSFTGLMNMKEKSEKAFLNWKKTKDKEMQIKKIEKRKEEERKVESEKQKAERKQTAEKAFQQWKTKLEENERKKERKMEMKKRKQVIEERKRRAEGSQISFQMWKEAKDEEIKQKIKEYRAADRTAREERFAQMEERMYEAEQAFEDWLERVDLRKQKQFCSLHTFQKNIPWIPA